MTEKELRRVNDFSVKNEFGSIWFEGKTDLVGVDLSKQLVIQKGEIVVYPDEDDKHPVGQKLNKPALLTMNMMKPKEG